MEEKLKFLSMKKDNTIKKIKMEKYKFLLRMNQTWYFKKLKLYKFNRILLLIKMVKNKKFIWMIEEIHII